MHTPKTFPASAVIAAAFLVGVVGPSGRAQERSQAAEIEQLQKRVSAQDQRIADLEQQIKRLLAAGKNAAAVDTMVPATDSGPAASVASPAAAPTPTPVSPAPAPSSGSPEIKIAGVTVAGDVYLFQYVPYDIPGARPKFELYAFSVKLTGQHGPWNFYSDYRLRTTKLRSFFPGNTWLQQGYVGYRTSFGEIQAGSFYRHVGLVWDDSFFGNIQYFDGLKLDPEFGVGFEGAHKMSGRLSAEYSAQYFTTDARINGSLPGRDFLSEPGARAKNDATLRFAPVWHFTDDVSLTVGGSYARGTIERDGGFHNTRWQYAGDATLQWRGLLAYGEVLNQMVNGVVIQPPQNATYTLVGTRWVRGRFQPRLNYSNANYHGFNRRREYIVQPGITVRLDDGFSFIYEYDYWKQNSTPTPMFIDKSLNFVLLYHF